MSLLALTACRGSDVAASSLPPELAVPAEATRMDSRGDGKGFAVRYRLAAAYPAQPFLDGVNARMTSRGWKPMEHDFLNPDIPTSNVRGWTAFVDSRSKPPVGVHQWQGSWTNDGGDLITYSLKYTAPVNGIGMPLAPDGQTNLEVNAFLLPAERARAMADAAQRLRKK